MVLLWWRRLRKDFKNTSQTYWPSYKVLNLICFILIFFYGILIVIAWLLTGSVKKLVLVVKSVETTEPLERWVFNCETSSSKDGVSLRWAVGSSTWIHRYSTFRSDLKSTKSSKEITQEIQAIIRQITASVTFLPLLNEPCSFDLLVYADTDAQVPITWEDSDPCYIANAEDVRLRSFTTKVISLLSVTDKLQSDPFMLF